MFWWTYKVALRYTKRLPSEIYACVLKCSETSRPTEAKFNGAPPSDRGKDGKLIQMFCCYSLLSNPVGGDI